MELGLAGRVSLVTGGSEGIGLATASELARQGARVAVCARRPLVLQAAVAAMQGAAPGATIIGVPADMNRPEEVEQLIDAVTAELGAIQILVNTVGGRVPGHFGELTDANFREALEGCLLTAVWPIRRVLPSMVASGWGRIINVAAVSGRQPTEAQLATNAGKAALINFTKSLSTEVATSGVTVNSVLPGRILTPGVSRRFDAPEQQRRIQAIPMQRYGTAEEVAAAIVFLASVPASYITGVALAVDGGLVSQMY